MANCILTGTLTYLDGSPIIGGILYVSPVDAPLFVTSSTGEVQGLSHLPTSFTTNENGYFSISLLQNATFKIIIKDIGLRENIKVPAVPTASLFSLLSGDVPVSPTTSTGSEGGSGGGAAW